MACAARAVRRRRRLRRAGLPAGERQAVLGGEPSRLAQLRNAAVPPFPPGSAQLAPQPLAGGVLHVERDQVGQVRPAVQGRQAGEVRTVPQLQRFQVPQVRQGVHIGQSPAEHEGAHLGELQQARAVERLAQRWHGHADGVRTGERGEIRQPQRRRVRPRPGVGPEVQLRDAGTGGERDRQQAEVAGDAELPARHGQVQCGAPQGDAERADVRRGGVDHVRGVRLPVERLDRPALGPAEEPGVVALVDDPARPRITGRDRERVEHRPVDRVGHGDEQVRARRRAARRSDDDDADTGAAHQPVAVRAGQRDDGRFVARHLIILASGGTPRESSTAGAAPTPPPAAVR